MPRLIEQPTIIESAGNKPKRIEEYAGHVTSAHSAISVARMRSPAGWEEPGQRPEFEEITVVLSGTLRVQYEGGILEVNAGQAVIAAPGEWVRLLREHPPSDYRRIELREGRQLPDFDYVDIAGRRHRLSDLQS